jgi:hypothetical protein
MSIPAAFSLPDNQWSFAARLGVPAGVVPSAALLAHAAARGIELVEATAEYLPFAEARFDQALSVATVCFVVLCPYHGGTAFGTALL